MNEFLKRVEATARKNYKRVMEELINRKNVFTVDLKNLNYTPEVYLSLVDVAPIVQFFRLKRCCSNIVLYSSLL